MRSRECFLPRNIKLNIYRTFLLLEVYRKCSLLSLPPMFCILFPEIFMDQGDVQTLKLAPPTSALLSMGQ